MSFYEKFDELIKHLDTLEGEGLANVRRELIFLRNASLSKDDRFFNSYLRLEAVKNRVPPFFRKNFDYGEGWTKILDDFRNKKVKKLKTKKKAGVQPSHQDLVDAIEHADEIWGQDGWILEDFDLEDLGDIPLEDVYQYDDVVGWLELSPEDFEGMTDQEKIQELSGFRGKAWANRAIGWLTNGIPPIIIVEDDRGSTVLGDGRGRFNFAVAMNIPKIHAFKLSLKKV